MTIGGGRYERWFFVAFGTFFVGISLAATLSFLLGDSDPMGLVIGAVMVAAGSYVVWMGLNWYSDGANGVVGGGPFMTVRLVPGESIDRVTPAVYRELPGRTGKFGAIFENDGGRLYLSDRRLIYCPSRFRPDRHPVSISLSDIAEVGDDPPWQMNFAHAGMTVATSRGERVALWFKDQSLVQEVRASASRASAESAPIAHGVGYISTGGILYCLAILVGVSVAMLLSVVLVETPVLIVAFFGFSMLIGLIGIAPVLLKYLRQGRVPRVIP